MTHPLDPKALEAAVLSVWHDFQSEYDLINDFMATNVDKLCQKAIQAYLTAAQSDEWVMVPREPTEEMIKEGNAAYLKETDRIMRHGHSPKETTRLCDIVQWKAMIEAVSQHPVCKDKCTCFRNPETGYLEKCESCNV